MTADFARTVQFWQPGAIHERISYTVINQKNGNHEKQQMRTIGIP